MYLSYDTLSYLSLIRILEYYILIQDYYLVVTNNCWIIVIKAKFCLFVSELVYSFV